MGRGMRNMYRVLVEKPEEKRLLGRHRCRQKENIEVNLKEIGWEGVGWIYLAEDKDK
jgi:hypothetical protein